MIKVRQKVSGGMRTCFFEALVLLAEGHPWLPEDA
jgi:hypothetical protein